jgi:glycosyltransferase involved in cell wall biosynthesis
MGFWTRIKAFLFFAIFATIKGVQLDGDIVFASSTPLTIAIPGILISKIKKIPMIFEVRDLWPDVPISLGVVKNRFFKLASLWLEKIAYKNSSHIVALAPGMKEVIVQKCPKAKVTIIPNGSDFELFSSNLKNLRGKLGFNNKDKIVLYTGAIGRVNNVEYLAEIAKEAFQIDQSVKFIVVGDGNMYDEIVSKTQNWKIFNKNFFFFPPVAKQNIPFWINSADLMVVFYKGPSCALKNSVQNKFFDALAAGKPVVFDHDGWSVKHLEKQRGAIRIPSENPRLAAGIIVKYLNDKQWLDNAGKQALGLAERFFNRNILAKELEMVLHSVLGERKT